MPDYSRNLRTLTACLLVLVTLASGRKYSAGPQVDPGKNNNLIQILLHHHNYLGHIEVNDEVSQVILLDFYKLVTILYVICFHLLLEFAHPRFCVI